MDFWFLSPLNVFLTESQNRKAYFQVVAKMGFFNDADSLNLEIHWSTGIEVVDVCVWRVIRDNINNCKVMGPTAR